MQYNFTDPESRIMKGPDGFVQAYNVQVAVDDLQLIVGQAVTQETTDKKQLMPMITTIAQQSGHLPSQLLADAGYCSDENLTAIAETTIDAYISTRKQRHGERPGPCPRGPLPTGATIVDRMSRKLHTQTGAAGYAARSLWRELDGPEHQCPAKQIPKFRESVQRKGFFEQEMLEKVLSALASDYRDVVEFAAFSGWRRQEIEGLTWDEVDLVGAVIRLSPERSKTREGRVLPIIGTIATVIQRRLGRRHGLSYVFTYQYGGKKTLVRHRPIGDWRKAWTKACVAAGCPGALFHDFRRTVVRNLTRAGCQKKSQWAGRGTRLAPCSTVTTSSTRRTCSWRAFDWLHTSPKHRRRETISDGPRNG